MKESYSIGGVLKRIQEVLRKDERHGFTHFGLICLVGFVIVLIGMEKTALESFDFLEKRGKQDLITQLQPRNTPTCKPSRRKCCPELTTLKALLLKESAAQPVAQVIPDDSDKDKKIAELQK